VRTAKIKEKGQFGGVPRRALGGTPPAVSVAVTKLSKVERFERAPLATRIVLVATSLLLAFSFVVSGLAFLAVSATKSVFPQERQNSSADPEEVAEGVASPSPVAARSATRTTAGKSRTAASRPAKEARSKGESLE
jgi:hypothetical protein